MFSDLNISEGCPYPLGATPDHNGVNFAIFSANAEKIELCLFDEVNKKEKRRISLIGYTDEIWHVYIEGLKPGTIYGYRAYGPYEPHRGLRFNGNKLLIDPYARELIGSYEWSPSMYGYDVKHDGKDLSKSRLDNAVEMVKCVVVEDALLDRRDREPKPNIPWSKTIIYEAHAKGMTKLNRLVPEEQRGTIVGLSHPEVLNYLKSLGVTAIELLPVHAYIDEPFLINHELTNYWGYNTLSFFSLHRPYLQSKKREEFRAFVDAAHKEGIEVILDVVYNHTAEGNHEGPTLSFRGIDNASYYTLASHDRRFYVNDTGCGNTLNIKHPRVLQMVMDSLRYWAGEIGVDGFRFDLASVLGREADGFQKGSGFFDAVTQDPLLSTCKMIAEPWDIGPGGYQLGNYPAGWSEWNDRYRDAIRRFWHGEPGVLPEVARRLHGSSDFFEHSGRGPWASINFITSHDGFTLEDLVSYSQRHNEANKENNRDGHHTNYSDNHGEEGPTNDPKIRQLRDRQKRNFLATLLLSQGTPMLLAGDEFGRSQQGNNNAYCQDNEMNWLDWDNIDEENRSLQSFVRNVIALRSRFPLLTSKVYMHKPDQPEEKDMGSVRWHSASGEEMRSEQWQQVNLHTLGWMLENSSFVHKKQADKCMLLVIFNSGTEERLFRLPSYSCVTHWQSVLDTCESDGVPQQELLVKESDIQIAPKSMQVLSAFFDS